MKIRPHGGLCGLLVLTLPALAQPVEIRVDAAAMEGPFRPIYAYLRLRRAELHLHGERQQAHRRAGRSEPGARRDPHASSAGHGRRHRGAEVGLDQRLHRRRRRQAGLRLDHRRPHLRHLRAGERQAVRRNRLHAARRSPANPEPYTLHWPKQDGKGWSYPPKDYAKWAELVRQWVLHAVARYGKAEVESWYWELWNEPDISYWRGTPEEYDKLYDYTADAVKRALPGAHVGGPGTTGPASAKAARLPASSSWSTARTASTPPPASPARRSISSAITPRARRNVVEGHVRMGLRKELADVGSGMRDRQRVSRVPRAAHRAQRGRSRKAAPPAPRASIPQNVYRNGTLYPSYTAAALGSIIQAGGPLPLQHRGHADLGVRVRRPALLRRLPHAGDQRHR